MNAVTIYVFKVLPKKIAYGVGTIRVSGNFGLNFFTKKASRSSRLVLSVQRHATTGSAEGYVSMSNRTSMESKHYAYERKDERL